MEQWRDIEGYEGLYQVSDMGNVKSLRSNGNLKPTLDSGGYSIVKLCKDKKDKTLKVHRLVAQAFIPNPENKPTVDHINTIRTDNRVSNLRWFTYREQIVDNEITISKIRSDTSHSQQNLLKAVEKNKKRVMCTTTGEVFDSAMEASKYYNIKGTSSVADAANPNHKRKSAGKLADGRRLIWKYID